MKVEKVSKPMIVRTKREIEFEITMKMTISIGMKFMRHEQTDRLEFVQKHIVSDLLIQRALRISEEKLKAINLIRHGM